MRIFRVPNPLAHSAAPNDPGIHVLLHPSTIRTAPHLDEQAGLDAYTEWGCEAMTLIVGVVIEDTEREPR